MILDELAEYARARVENAKKRISFQEIRERAMSLPKGNFRFQRALENNEMSFICEIKRASPSKGIISEEFPYLEIAKEYEAAGAQCISCLTEPKWFMGSDEIFCDIRSKVNLPMLRKDFTVDEYQLYEARCMEADAVLLICALLDTKTIFQFLMRCEEMRICAIVEAHDEEEIKSAVSAGARLIGINNRNLKDFTVDFTNTLKLKDKIPADILLIAESGIKSQEDIKALKKAGVDAVIIGESLMKAKNKGELLESFRRAASEQSEN